MRVLVACEESQAVTTALRELGHEAYSCDILPCSGGHDEWHIQGDCLPLLNGNCNFTTRGGVQVVIDGQWDMIIAFPPCTYTTNAGAKHLFRHHHLNVERYYKGMCGKALFEAIRHAECERIAIENPTPSKIFEYPPPTQAIQPFQFGHKWSKKTLLWLYGLPELIPTNIVTPECNCHEAGTWFMKGGKDRQVNRSKLCKGFAEAMASQWAGDCRTNSE